MDIEAVRRKGRLRIKVGSVMLAFIGLWFGVWWVLDETPAGDLTNEMISNYLA